VVEGQQVWLSRVLDGAAGLEAGGQLPLCSMTMDVVSWGGRRH
jgi:hypothetical protein